MRRQKYKKLYKNYCYCFNNLYKLIKERLPRQYYLRRYFQAVFNSLGFDDIHAGRDFFQGQISVAFCVETGNRSAA